MRKFYLSLFVLCCTFSSLFATVRPNQGEFALTGEWLYLYPVIDNGYYAVSANTNNFRANNSIGDREANNLCYDSGFRVEAMYAFCDCCSDIRVSYTGFCSDHKETLSSDFLFPTNGDFLIAADEGSTPPQGFTNATASSKIKFEFDRVEALFGVRFWQCCGLSVVLEGGLQYADFEVRETDRYQGTVNAVVRDIYVIRKATYWGVGPQLGLDFNYCLCGGLSFVGNVNWAILVGENSNDFFQQFPDPADATITNSIDNETICRIVPTTQIRVGFDYRFCCCWDWAIGAGYEFISNPRTLDSIVFTELNNLQSVDNYSNTDLHGPYVSLTATF